MLLQLENTSQANLKKLLEYARELKLKLRVIELDEGNTSLPGKPLSANTLKTIIEKSRKSGVISIDTAHQTIRNSFHED